MKKIINDRCPLQGECERSKCGFIGKELDCPYYFSNAVPGCDIDDQEEVRERRRREREKAELLPALGYTTWDAAGKGPAPVSELDTAAPQLRTIPLEDLLPSPENFYQLRDVDALADAIALDGLQQPLLVTPHPGKPGKYRIISGHRRRAAIEKLVKDKDQPREDLRPVPCMVRTYSSPAMAELQLILANSTARVLNNAEISRQAERIETLLYQLKEEGHQFPGRMRDQVAAACKVSAPKLARLKVIREKLKAPELVLLWEKDKLSEQAAYALARLPEDFQARIAKAMGAKAADIAGGRAEKILKLYGEGWRWEPDLTCPDGAACRRGDTFLRHDLENYDACGGRTCCLKCPKAKQDWYACDRMCSKAKAARKDKKEKQEAKAARESEKRKKKYQEETRRSAQRLLTAIDAAGLPDDTAIKWANYYRNISVGDIRKWAQGQFRSDMCWNGPELDPKSLSDPAALSKRLGCSTDFLLGLTDDFRPAAAPAGKPAESSPEPERVPEISPEPAGGESPDGSDAGEARPGGDPPAEGWVPLVWLDGRERPDKDGQLAAIKFTAEGITLRSIAQWSASLLEWRYPGGGEIGNVKILGWFPLPED